MRSKTQLPRCGNTITTYRLHYYRVEVIALPVGGNKRFYSKSLVQPYSNYIKRKTFF